MRFTCNHKKAFELIKTKFKSTNQTNSNIFFRKLNEFSIDLNQSIWKV